MSSFATVIPVAPREPLYDLAIVGGGANGCGIARDAAGRGLAVFLCDKGDLAGGTSSASTKLVHGGLRYLETYDFRLVREALKERETLMRIAPHIVRPMRFVLPHEPNMRSWLVMRLGLFLYDHIGGAGALPGTRSFDLRRDPAGASLARPGGRAFEYSDCWVDDSRLVVLNALDAAERGAVIAPRTRCVAADRVAGRWRLTMEGPRGRETVRARALVNAAGPWVGEFLAGVAGADEPAPIRLVRGSHIVTRRLFEHRRAYLFQQPDRRVVFAIPFEREFTLIGTTDVDHPGSPDAVEPSEEEIGYLLAAANRAFAGRVGRGDIVCAFAGVRPLHDDGSGPAQQASRDYLLDLEAGDGRPPLLSVIGGKITTYRKLAEAAMEILAPLVAAPPANWTAKSPLPGGDAPRGGMKAVRKALMCEHPYLDRAHAKRLIATYGTRARQVLRGARSADDLGRVFGADLTEREIRYLAETEWASTVDDILWRRTKLGLVFSAAERASLEGWLRTTLAA